MLLPGLYEQVINTALNCELVEIPEARKSVAPIDKAEASKILAQYLADVVQKGLENVADNGGGISTQIGLANQIVNLIQNTTKEADFAALSVDLRAEQLLALLQEQDPRLAVGKTAADLSRPETSIAQSSLFTGAIHEPQMYTELKKEIVSADRIDMLVSFIKWSGLRLLIDELREFTQNGGELRIITTSYMGATDVKAIEELRALPSTKIKVSYDTKRTRLHAKTYVFYRDTGFTTAYVGSSNLSNAAISSGLEWNVKVTRRDLPETIDKIAATFESYWNSNEFEYYSEDQKERLARALKAEKYFDANNAEVYTMDIAPYSYQQEILDKLEAERTVRGYQLGKCWRDGLGVLPDDERAELWFRRAAGAGYDFAQYALGKFLQSQRRTDEAVSWYEKAAAQGNSCAAYRLGKLYLEGKDVPKDVPKAVACLTESAQQGNQYAQYALGKLYLTGQGVKQDREQAWTYFYESAEQGNEYAAFFLEHFDQARRPNVFLAATRLLHHLSQIFRDNSVPPAAPVGQRVDRKLRRKIQEKKIAMGHKPDDHEETPQQNMGGMTMGW